MQTETTNDCVLHFNASIHKVDIRKFLSDQPLPLTMHLLLMSRLDSNTCCWKVTPISYDALQQSAVLLYEGLYCRYGTFFFSTPIH